MRGEPFRLKFVAGLAQIRHHVLPIELDKVRQHEAVVQHGSPPHEFSTIRRFPEVRRQRPHQQLLRQTHLRVRRHFECAQFQQTKPRAGRIGRIEFVDAELGAMRVARQIGKQVTEDAIGQP